MKLGDAREYRLISANYRNRVYEDGYLLVDEVGEIELRQWTGKGKKVLTAVVRFRPELPVSVTVEGPLLRVSDLTISLESSTKAAEVAELIRRPVRAQEAEHGLAEAEASLRDFLVPREEALAFLSRLKADPRKTLLTAESLWAAGAQEDPLDAVYASYSAKLGESLDKMTSSLSVAEARLGPVVFERLCALACIVGAAQDETLGDGTGRDKLFDALKELGVTAEAKDLEEERLTQRLMERAHPGLNALAVEQALRAQRLEA